MDRLHLLGDIKEKEGGEACGKRVREEGGKEKRDRGKDGERG